MFGIGPAELLIILVIAVLVFGGPILVFLLGYQLGRKSAERADDVEVVIVEPQRPETHAQSLKEEAEQAWEEHAEDE